MLQVQAALFRARLQGPAVVRALMRLGMPHATRVALQGGELSTTSDDRDLQSCDGALQGGYPHLYRGLL